MLVDGSSYLYRAFHALPELKSPKGEPTGAIYGVLNMLRRLAADYKAQARACVFDAKGRTFRDDAYAQYKAHRAPMPDDLALQVEPLKEAVQALGWPVLCVDAVEADDVIATLADRATREGWRTVISTGDKDLAQLVDGQVMLVNTMSNERLDIEGVTKKFGVPPEKIVDYLSLVGDAIDNIPGVDKVGPKTACKWIVQYGSLEGVMAHAGEIGGIVGENLRKALDWLPQARSLVTVKRDVALPFSLEELTAHASDLARQRVLYARFGFKTWLREVEESGSSSGNASRAPEISESSKNETPSGPPRRSYATVWNETELEGLLKKLHAAPLVGFDTECVGLEPMSARLVGMSFALGREAFYLPLAHEYPGAPAQVSIEQALRL
ncbi:MAG TPA: 5'-3' exonuclease H3TH domain-containing protein, partial [Burkholderiales bacterium]|nr:5'-3' exonuclease H3TH domain-containing protein [Burkholderiales bacterium]